MIIIVKIYRVVKLNLKDSAVKIGPAFLQQKVNQKHLIHRKAKDVTQKHQIGLGVIAMQLNQHDLICGLGNQIMQKLILNPIEILRKKEINV